MVIRIRLRTPHSILDFQSQVALALAALFAPSALLAFTVCFWSFAAELGLVGEFYVRAGIFSHWQVWFALAGALPFAGTAIRRRINDVVSDEHVE